MSEPALSPSQQFVLDRLNRERLEAHQVAVDTAIKKGKPVPEEPPKQLTANDLLYPRWLYHSKHGGKLVKTEAEHSKLLKDFPGLWADSPADLKKDIKKASAPKEDVAPEEEAPEEELAEEAPAVKPSKKGR